MAAEIINISLEGDTWLVDADFRAAAEAIDVAKAGGITILYGEEVYEQLRGLSSNSRARKQGLNYNWASDSGTSYERFAGRRARYNRIANFIRWQAPYNFPELRSTREFAIDTELLGFLRQLNTGKLRTVAGTHYAETRRKPDLHPGDFPEFMDNLRWDHKRPFVIHLGSQAPLTYQNVLFLLEWLAARDQPLIVLLESKTRPTESIADAVIERDYISIEELLALFQQRMHFPIGKARRLLPIFQASFYLGGSSTFERGLASKNLSQRILKFLQGAQDIDLGEGQGLSVPGQQLAPAIFAIRHNVLDLRREHTETTTEAEIRGAARALLAQCLELTGSIKFGNLLPRYDSALQRVADLLGAISTESMIDDSILVELGMEIDYLAGRAALARERLGKETTEELAVFIIAAKRYTLRLSVVQRYEERLAPLHTR